MGGRVSGRAPNSAQTVDKVMRKVWLSWCCRAYDTGSAHFIPSVEVKMLFMSVGWVRVWAVSVVQVICMPIYYHPPHDQQTLRKIPF